MESGSGADKLPKRGVGRPEFAPTPEQRKLVRRLAGLLVPQAEIASDWIDPPICLDTLRKHFRDELDHGFEHTTARLRLRVLRSAENGSIKAAIWLLDRLCPEFSPPRERVGTPPARKRRCQPRSLTEAAISVIGWDDISVTVRIHDVEVLVRALAKIDPATAHPALPEDVTTALKFGLCLPPEVAEGVIIARTSRPAEVAAALSRSLRRVVVPGREP